MGRVLFIRLLAVTYEEHLVFQAWPHLCALAWPEEGNVFLEEWVKKTAPQIFSGTPARAHGVVELGAALLEQARFAGWKPNFSERVRPGLVSLQAELARLTDALGDWKPKAAYEASFAIEDALDGLERLAADSL